VKHIDFSAIRTRLHQKKISIGHRRVCGIQQDSTDAVFEQSFFNYSDEEAEAISSLERFRNTSVTKLTVDTVVVRFASVAFEELLTSHQTSKAANNW
jgi:hypothetical protein